MLPTEIGESGKQRPIGQNGRDRFKMEAQGQVPECPQALPQPCPYRAPGPPEVQVDSLARLVEMFLHILFPKAQECVHADVEATLRLLQYEKKGRKHREDEAWPGGETTKTSKRKALFANTMWLLASHLAF